MSHHTGAVPDTPRATNWRDHGLCGHPDEDADDWFPVGSSPDALAAENHAKTVCWRCPSLQACGQWALEHPEPAGIWGGMTEAERRTFLRRRGVKLLNTDDDDTPPRTMRTVWDAHAKATGDGHCVWAGGRPVKFAGCHYTPQQIGFILTRGRAPVGPVRPTCSVAGCILPAHLADQRERERSRVKAAVV